MKKKPAITREDVLAEIQRIYRQEPQKEYEFTVDEFAVASCVGQTTAERRMKELIGSGELRRRLCLVGNRHRWVYWFPAHEQKG